MTANTTTQEIVLLRGASLLNADTLIVIATLGDEGLWRTPDGAITDAIGVPQQAARAIVNPEHQRAVHKAQDAAWIQQSLATVQEIAGRQREVTVDDFWTHLAMPPRKPSLMSTLMVAADRAGLIEKTSRHRRSTRPINGGRTVRIWRSRIYRDSLPLRITGSPANAAPPSTGPCSATGESMTRPPKGA